MNSMIHTSKKRCFSGFAWFPRFSEFGLFWYIFGISRSFKAARKLRRHTKLRDDYLWKLEANSRVVDQFLGLGDQRWRLGTGLTQMVPINRRGVLHFSSCCLYIFHTCLNIPRERESPTKRRREEKRETFVIRSCSSKEIQVHWSSLLFVQVLERRIRRTRRTLRWDLLRQGGQELSL